MNCKKNIVLTLFMLGFGTLSYAASVSTYECGSHVFVPRGASTDLAWIDLLTFYDKYHKHPDKKFYFSAFTLYQQSRKNSERFASSLLLGNGNNSIQVTQGGGAGIVNSLELGLATQSPAAPFSSTFTINPTRKQFTYLGYLYANLDDWWCGLWGDVTFGVTNVHHRLNCCEVGNTSTLCPGITTVGQALSSDQLLYSRFYCNSCYDGKRRTGFEDVLLRLGYNYEWCGQNLIGVYLAGTIPAGRSPTAKYIFEPLVGSKHASFGVGFLADYNMNFCGCGDDANLTLMTDFYYRYVFNHRECRTFDLLPNGKFSRYILVVDSSTPGLPFPAANITTSSVNIQPRSTIQWWLGLNYERCDWDFEIGYNLFWRQKERLKQDCVPLPTTVGIYNLNGCGLSQFTASNATMTSSGTADAAFVPLSSADIDINSGLAGKLITNKVYGALSWTGCACDCFDWMAGFGASYEFVVNHDKCNALSSWAIFGKWAVGF